MSDPKDNSHFRHELARAPFVFNAQICVRNLIFAGLFLSSCGRASGPRHGPSRSNPPFLGHILYARPFILSHGQNAPPTASVPSEFPASRNDHHAMSLWKGLGTRPLSWNDARYRDFQRGSCRSLGPRTGDEPSAESCILCDPPCHLSDCSACAGFDDDPSNLRRSYSTLCGLRQPTSRRHLQS